MSRTLLIRPEAEHDLVEAHRWYEQRSPALGAEFLAAIHALLERIRLAPEMHAAEYRSVRRTTANRFPYVVYYRLRGEAIEVLAVLHGSRNPRIWRLRT